MTERSLFLKYPLLILFMALLVSPLMADPVSLDLSVIGAGVHGTPLIGPTVVTGFGLTITIQNSFPNNNHTFPNEGALFDTTATGTADPDLEDAWSLGNIPLNTVVGLALIVQETNGSEPGDDEGTRPAGTMTFDFDSSISQFGLTLLDIEGTSPQDEPGSIELWNGVTKLGEIDFMDFIARDAALYGNNSINRISPLTASDVNAVGNFDKVVINMGGSGATGEFNWHTVPEPGSMMLLGAGLLGIAGLRIKRSN